jgi:DNA-binding transcriptional LysR family regulator
MNLPSLEQWRLFVQIADHGSLTQAAAARDVAQPALSRQLAAFERSCGGRLFERNARGLRLNEAGQSLYPRVVDWLAQADLLLRDARGPLRGPAGTVHLGLLASLAPALVGAVFTTVRERFPGITLRISSGLSGWLADSVQAGRIDLALLSTNSRERHKQEIPIGHIGHVLVGAPGDALTRMPTVPFARLDGLPLVVPGRPYAFHNLLEHWAARKGIRLNVVGECDSLQLQKQLVLGSGVYAIMAGSAVREELADGRLQAARVVGPVLNRNIVLRTDSTRAPTQACKEVLRIVQPLAVAALRADPPGEGAAPPVAATRPKKNPPGASPAG